MEEKIAHLGFIQGIITRMGNNSFLIKGWAVTLIAAIFALAAKDANAKFVYLALFPVIVFWGLDAFFLRQEKLYRELYKKVANDTIPSKNFTLDASDFEKDVPNLLCIATSKTLLPYYGAISALIGVYVWRVL